MELPSPSDCIGVLGVGIGFIGGVIGLALVLIADVTPWGFVVFALSGWVAFSSVLYCLIWEWEHIEPV
jgi:hypothetical protein